MTCILDILKGHMILLIAIGTFFATAIGGLCALRFNDKLHLILGFSAGAVIGVAFFDLLPESIKMGEGFYDPSVITFFVAIGFILYTIIDRYLARQSGDHDHENGNVHRARVGAGSLSLHSFLDGLAIGFAFNVSISVGLIVALAVLAHDFSDGINTVSMVLRHGGDKKQAFKWLFVDALAPVLGILFSFCFNLPEKFLGLTLAVFCGFFLYIGATDLLPESHHNHPTLWTTFATVLGMAVIFLAIHFAV